MVYRRIQLFLLSGPPLCNNCPFSGATNATPMAVIAENNEFLVLIARSLPVCEHSRPRTGGLQERAVSVCCRRLLGCAAELERLGLAEQVALGCRNLTPNNEQTSQELGIRSAIIKTM